jgi:hypothetical protein
MDNDKNIPMDTDAYDEELSSQEELYLEETGEGSTRDFDLVRFICIRNRPLHSDRELRIARTRFGGKGIHDRRKEQSSHRRDSR